MTMFLNRVTTWLRSVPIDDPVDRRNAPFVQVLLVFFAVYVPVNKALYLWLVFSGRWPARPALAFDVVTDVLMCMVAYVAVWMIRRGHFRRAVSLFLGMVMVMMLIGYATVDIKAIQGETLPLLILALGGLVLGQRALWVIAALQVVSFVVCMISNILGFSPSFEPPWVVVGIAVSLIGSYLLLAVIVDRAVSALRHSLAESLAHAHRLEQEIAERKRTMKQLVHAMKMEVVGRVASGVAHDFDNVLSVILGYTSRSQRLADGGVGPLLKAMNGIRDAAEHALQVSGRLLSFSRRDAEHLEVLDLSELIVDALPMLKQLFGSRVRLNADLPDEPLRARIDRGQFELVLLSIAANARDAMPEGGSFTVTLRRTAPDALAVELGDTGSGIAEDHLEHLFEPFYTTKPAGEGTGLGLSVARDVMLRAGGDIVAYNRAQGGAVFVLHLPLAQAWAGVVQGDAAALPANT